jgi:FtsH-binding integral membrane protein
MKDTIQIRALLWGVAGMLLASLGLGAVIAALVESGMFHASVLPAASWGITLVSGIFGGLITAKSAGKLRLPLALAAVLCYLLLIFILRGLIFRTVGETPWMIPVWTAAGGVIGALLASSGTGKRRR